MLNIGVNWEGGEGRRRGGKQYLVCVIGREGSTDFVHYPRNVEAAIETILFHVDDMAGEELVELRSNASLPRLEETPSRTLTVSELIQLWSEFAPVMMV